MNRNDLICQAVVVVIPIFDAQEWIPIFSLPILALYVPIALKVPYVLLELSVSRCDTVMFVWYHSGVVVKKKLLVNISEEVLCARKVCLFENP